MTITAAKTYIQNNYADLEKRIGSLTASALPHYRSIFKQLARLNPKNAQLVCDFMATDYNEQNVIKAHQIDPHQGHLLLYQIFEIQRFPTDRKR
jgi:hypothetical protein